MAHLIDEILDTCATAQGDDRAWHMRDIQVNFATASASDVGLAYKANVERLLRESTGEACGKYGVWVDGNPEMLQTVSDRFTPPQPSELYEFMQRLAKRVDGRMTSALSMRKRVRVAGSILLPGSMQLNKGDKLEKYLSVANAYDGSHSLDVRCWHHRGVCNNTVVSPDVINSTGNNALYQRKANVKDAFDIDSAVEETAKRLESIVIAHGNMVQDTFNKLIDTRFDDGTDRVRFCNLIAKGGNLISRILTESDPNRNLLERCMDATLNVDLFKKIDSKEPANKKAKDILWAMTTGAGQDHEAAKGSAWGALNGLTNWQSNSNDEDGSRMLFGEMNDEQENALLLLSAVANTAHA